MGKEKKRERVDKGEGIKVKCGDSGREREREWKGKSCEMWKERGRGWERKGRGRKRVWKVERKRVMKIERQNVVMVEGKRRGTGRGKNRM